jgi:hypothetical protein
MLLLSDRIVYPRIRSAPIVFRRCRVFAGLGALAALGVLPALSQQQQPQEIGQPAPWAASQPAAVRMPDANAQMQLQQQSKQTKQAKYETANAARRKQLADDAARLLQLATELKTAVDKTDKDTLSLDVIRKAESIERLAKGVKEKMKLTSGAS